MPIGEYSLRLTAVVLMFVVAPMRVMTTLPAVKGIQWADAEEEEVWLFVAVADRVVTLVTVAALVCVADPVGLADPDVTDDSELELVLVLDPVVVCDPVLDTVDVLV